MRTTPMLQETYLKHGGERCPFCESGQICSGELTIHGSSASLDIFCRDCKKSWIDKYELVGYAPMGE